MSFLDFTYHISTLVVLILRVLLIQLKDVLGWNQEGINDRGRQVCGKVEGGERGTNVRGERR